MKSLDVDLLDELAKDHSLFVTVEENVKSGRIRRACVCLYGACHPEIRVLSAAVWDRFVPQGKVEGHAQPDWTWSGDIRQAIEE